MATFQKKQKIGVNTSSNRLVLTTDSEKARKEKAKRKKKRKATKR